MEDTEAEASRARQCLQIHLHLQTTVAELCLHKPDGKLVLRWHQRLDAASSTGVHIYNKAHNVLIKTLNTHTEWQ